MSTYLDLFGRIPVSPLGGGRVNEVDELLRFALHRGIEKQVILADPGR